MKIVPLSTLIVYFLALLGFAFYFYRKQKSETDFILGDRGLNFWLTALSAHASDMSSWLFIGYPALIYTTGVFGAWAEGKDSFEKDPPNAVLIIGNSEPVVVELILVSWNEERATFKIISLKGEISDKSGPVTLFVDVDPSIADIEKTHLL